MQTPQLVGKNIIEVSEILSNHNLNLRILAQKEDADLPTGTILNQTPPTPQRIKPHQSVFLVLSKKPPLMQAPLLVHKSRTAITQELAHSNIRTKACYLPSPYPHDSCIAQIPAAGESLPTNRLMLYFSASANKPIIWPDFTRKPVADVVEFLENHRIEPHITHVATHKAHHTCDTCSVVDQRPLPGSLITLDAKHPPYVQLYVQ